jgi:hypothetical protein
MKQLRSINPFSTIVLAALLLVACSKKEEEFKGTISRYGVKYSVKGLAAIQRFALAEELLLELKEFPGKTFRWPLFRANAAQNKDSIFVKKVQMAWRDHGYSIEGSVREYTREFFENCSDNIRVTIKCTQDNEDNYTVSTFNIEEPEVEHGVSEQSPHQTVIAEDAFQIVVPKEWKRTYFLPKGINVGFSKVLAGEEKSTFFFHHEVMPPEAGEPPSDTRDMESQWNTMVRNQFPDAMLVNVTSPSVHGRVLINQAYDLTDDGVKVRRRYTYFLSNRTAFVVQCTAPQKRWDQLLADFDGIISTLKPGDGHAPPTVSDDDAVSNLNKNLPTLLSSFPTFWSCSLSSSKISIESGQRILDISLAFERSDIFNIYDATKTVFTMLKEGKSDADLNKLPQDKKEAASESAAFIKYVGQVWGLASGYIANSKEPIDRYRIRILNANDKVIGSIAISRDDGAAILSGKVTAEEGQRVAGMYVFE